MTQCDNAILELLDNGVEEPLVLTPATIEMNIDYSASTIRPRMRILEEEGLIEYWDASRGAYRISEKGGKYLRGELDSDDLDHDL